MGIVIVVRTSRNKVGVVQWPGDNIKFVFAGLEVRTISAEIFV